MENGNHRLERHRPFRAGGCSKRWIYSTNRCMSEYKSVYRVKHEDLEVPLLVLGPCELYLRAVIDALGRMHRKQRCYVALCLLGRCVMFIDVNLLFILLPLVYFVVFVRVCVYVMHTCACAVAYVYLIVFVRARVM